MASRPNPQQSLNHTTDTYSRPVLVEEPIKNNTLNHYYPEGQHRVTIDQQR